MHHTLLVQVQVSLLLSIQSVFVVSNILIWKILGGCFEISTRGNTQHCFLESILTRAFLCALSEVYNVLLVDVIKSE